MSKFFFHMNYLAKKKRIFLFF